MSHWCSFCFLVMRLFHSPVQNFFTVPKLQVESIVLRRYGRDAYRMFRLLSKAGLLQETDKVLNLLWILLRATAYSESTFVTKC